jgi:hypothetical protein
MDDNFTAAAPEKPFNPGQSAPLIKYALDCKFQFMGY